MLSEFEAEAIRMSRLLDEALGFYKGTITEYAQAEDAYRLAKAKAILEATGTVDERRAQADLVTSMERQRALLADGMRQAGLEAIRSRRQQLSAIQSLLSAHRVEAEFERTRGDV